MEKALANELAGINNNNNSNSKSNSSARNNTGNKGEATNASARNKSTSVVENLVMDDLRGILVHKGD
eukprot:975768-Pleurochrysis_carterae.AAC.1